MQQLILSQAYQRQTKKLIKRNPNLKPKISKALKHLAKDINHPSLGLHKLTGQSNWSISVTPDIHIIIHWEKDKLFLTRIGTHDQVY